MSRYLNPYTDFGFKKLFGEEACLDSEQLEQYQKSLHSYWEVNSAIDTAREEGLEKGLQKGIALGLAQGDKQAREAIARSLFGVLDVDTIALKTGLTVEAVNALQYG